MSDKIDLGKVKELISFVDEFGVKKLSIKDDTGFEINIEGGGEVHHHVSTPHVAYAPPPVAPPPPAPAAAEAPAAPAPEPAADESGDPITSPMVGTFYSSPSPDDPVFVKVGDTVDPDTVVCIIEAMKVMNEVKAGKKGVVKKVSLSNAEPVEFGTELFIIG